MAKKDFKPITLAVNGKVKVSKIDGGDFSISFKNLIFSENDQNKLIQLARDEDELLVTIVQQEPVQPDLPLEE